jgi:hypothetical protein
MEVVVMQNFGFNFKEFFDTYFAENDEAFLTNLGEIISEKDDSKEIAALADWSFRNYIIDALTIALELNNERIYNDVMDMLQSRAPAGRNDRREVSPLPPPPVATARRTEEPYSPPRVREDPYAHSPRGYEDPYTQPQRGYEDPHTQPQRGYEDPHRQIGRGHEDPYGPISRRGPEPSYGVPPLPRGVREEQPPARLPDESPLSSGYRGMPEIQEIRDLKKMAMFASQDDSNDEEDGGAQKNPQDRDFDK